jgi:hypothetical protein
MPCTAQITGFHTPFCLAPRNWPGSSSLHGDAVDACGEGSVAVALQDDDVDVVVRPAPRPDRPEFVEHHLVEGVEHLGTVEGDRRDVPRDLEGHR